MEATCCVADCWPSSCWSVGMNREIQREWNYVTTYKEM